MKQARDASELQVRRPRELHLHSVGGYGWMGIGECPECDASRHNGTHGVQTTDQSAASWREVQVSAHRPLPTAAAATPA